MRKTTVAIASLLVILSLTASYAILCNPVAVEAARDRPSMKIELNATKVNVNGVFDSWIFVTNPSRNMDTQGDPSTGGRLPVHVVTCNSIRLVWTLPDGTVASDETFYPGVPPLAYRWNPIVNPMEDSMVFFVGWNMFGVPGKHTFTYTLSVTYEGQTYLLTDTFNIHVRS